MQRTKSRSLFPSRALTCLSRIGITTRAVFIAALKESRLADLLPKIPISVGNLDASGQANDHIIKIANETFVVGASPIPGGSLGHSFFRFNSDRPMVGSASSNLPSYPGIAGGRITKISSRGTVNDSIYTFVEDSGRVHLLTTHDGSNGVANVDFSVPINPHSLVGNLESVGSSANKLICLAALDTNIATFVFGKYDSGSAYLMANGDGYATTGSIYHPVPVDGKVVCMAWRRENGDSGSLRAFLDGSQTDYQFLSFPFGGQSQQHGTLFFVGQDVDAGDVLYTQMYNVTGSDVETLAILGFLPDSGEDGEILTFGGDMSTVDYYLTPFATSVTSEVSASGIPTRHPIPKDGEITAWAYNDMTGSGTPVVAVLVNGAQQDTITYTGSEPDNGTFTTPISVSAGDYVELKHTTASWGGVIFNLFMRF